MFPFLLVLRNLTRHRLRLALTTASLTVAVFVLILLRSLVVALDAGVQAAASDRLIVQSAVSLFVSMPLGYEPKIRQVEGIQELTKFQWFGGVYQERSGFFAQFGVDPEAFFRSYPEVNIVEGSAEDFVASRESAIIGRELAKKYGWEVGDSVPIQGTIFRRVQGDAWNFRIAGIYESTRANVDEGTMYFHFENLDQALRGGAAEGPEGAGVFVLRIAPGADALQIMADVDALFEHGPQRVQTTTEAEFAQQFVSMVGDVPFFLGSLGSGILLAILLAALNTMLMAAREQTRDIGVLKSLGFSDGTVGSVLLAQSLLICGVGGGLGVLLALVTEPAMAQSLGSMFPGYTVTHTTALQALALSLALGLVAGLLPAWRAARTRVVDTLRMEI